MIFKTIIIDDEELARLRLLRLLKPYADLIEVVAEASNGQDGLEFITRLRPDLIFLDIQMPLLNGFEMLAQLKVQPKVIFTTAYDQYAIKAFEEDSIDYLLKPVEAERLEKTVGKLEKLNTKSPAQELPLESLLKALNIKKELKTLTVKVGDRILLVKLDDIAYIEAEDKYVFLHCRDGRKHLTDFTITALEEKLPEHFIRIHRGTILNSEMIREIRKGFNGSLIFVLTDNDSTRVNSSRGHGDTLRARFGI